MERPQAGPERKLLCLSTIGNAWLQIFTSTMLDTIIVPALPYVLNLSPLRESAVFSARPVSSIIVTPVASWMTEAMGWRPLIIFPGVLLTLGSIVYFYRADFTVYVAARLVQGCASAFIWTAALGGVARTHPPEIQATATGLVMTADVGIAIGPLIGGVLFDWGGTTMLFSFMIVFCAAATVVTAMLFAFFPNDLPVPEHPSESETLNHSTKGYRVFLNYHYVVAVVAVCCIYAFATALPALLPLYWHRKFGLSATLTGLLFSPNAFIKVVVSPVATLLSDFGLATLTGQYSIGLLFASVCLAFIVTPPDWRLQAFLLTLFGIGFGTVDTCATAFAGSKFLADRRRTDYGMSYGLVEQGFNVGVLLGPLIVGGLTEWTNYHTGFMTLGAVGALVAVMAVVSWKTYRPPYPSPRHVSAGEQMLRREQDQLAAALLRGEERGQQGRVVASQVSSVCLS
uniref:Major facilitator superfamily (MFS) profile domain-containing protein n=1 Tax=Vitrella brassicaformis TaxID=1169539 RepID=A0A7S1P5Y3_9ALVE|mmetsp:Transcript_35509/g.88259  ORF Transcript_35509/g.88259 Transcript_35509/m.88259 type:complete len:456 (+) Transcript_35509:65-1432(+)